MESLWLNGVPMNRLLFSLLYFWSKGKGLFLFFSFFSLLKLELELQMRDEC